jgi:replicative DNA helicase
MSELEQEIKNIQVEIMLIGCIYKNPEFLIEYGNHIKSKYDFSDEVTKFFYDNAEIIFKTRSQTFNESTINLFMTEDKDRLILYKKYGAWKNIETWMDLAVIEDFKNYFDILKKYSLLREYHRNGFNVNKIIEHPKFQLFGPLDIYRLIRSKADKIHTVILTNNESEILNEKVIQLLDGCLEKPDMGLSLPFPIMSELFRGIRINTMMANAALSNSGKSRYMFKIIAYLALVLKQKVCVLLNEMSIQDMKFCLLSTVINNPEFQKLHGYKLEKNERDLTLGLYKNTNGEYIYRKVDGQGNYIETIEEYKIRIQNESIEYNQILNIGQWIENETNGLIFAKDVSDNYDDTSLAHEIRKHSLIYNIKYFFYDTLKNDISSVGEWAALKVTVTKLSQLTSELNCFIYGSLQLTDDVNHIEPLMMSSSNISECKAIKHVLDSLTMFKHLRKDEYSKYYWIDRDNWGEPIKKELDFQKKLAIFIIDKNRTGRKTALLFECDLDKNRWIELGEVFKK